MTSSTQTRTPPWQAGWAAARANLVPGLMVQGVILTLVVTYYWLPKSRAAWDTLADCKVRWGYFYSALSAAVAGGIFPELLRVAAFQKGRPTGKNLRHLLFAVPFWAVQGAVVDGFYRCQAAWFGTDASLGTVMMKVAVDQFLYNPLFAAPLGVITYEWKKQGWRWSRSFLTAKFYQEKIIPALVATWGFWVPSVSLVYALPSSLQVPVFGLALTCWVLIFTWISEANGRDS